MDIIDIIDNWLNDKIDLSLNNISSTHNYIIDDYISINDLIRKNNKLDEETLYNCANFFYYYDTYHDFRNVVHNDFNLTNVKKIINLILGIVNYDNKIIDTVIKHISNSKYGKSKVDIYAQTFLKIKITNFSQNVNNNNRWYYDATALIGSTKNINIYSPFKNIIDEANSKTDTLEARNYIWNFMKLNNYITYYKESFYVNNKKYIFLFNLLNSNDNTLKINNENILKINNENISLYLNTSNQSLFKNSIVNVKQALEQYNGNNYKEILNNYFNIKIYGIIFDNIVFKRLLYAFKRSGDWGQIYLAKLLQKNNIIKGFIPGDYPCAMVSLGLFNNNILVDKNIIIKQKKQVIIQSGGEIKNNLDDCYKIKFNKNDIEIFNNYKKEINDNDIINNYKELENNPFYQTLNNILFKNNELQYIFSLRFRLIMVLYRLLESHIINNINLKENDTLENLLEQIDYGINNINEFLDSNDDIINKFIKPSELEESMMIIEDDETNISKKRKRNLPDIPSTIIPETPQLKRRRYKINYK
jgi:hypothetical protein